MLIWIAISIGAVALTVVASRKAVYYAAKLAQGLSVPPFLIGVTLVSIGTDIPEISTSIIASITQHGDLLVGDSIGSVMTQITLVFGLLPFFAGTILINRTRIAVIGGFTIVALALGILLILDGFLSRFDAVILISAWILFTFLSWKLTPLLSEPVLPEPSKRKLFDTFLVVFFLLLVGAGAGAFVMALVELSSLLGVPEYLISFFGASLGTSLPELAVDVTALMSGKRDIAIGDIVGSCLVDATLSIGAGPLISPTAVTALLAIQGALIAIVFTALCLLVVGIRQKHDRWTGAFMLALYVTGYLIFIAR